MSPTSLASQEGFRLHAFALDVATKQLPPKMKSGDVIKHLSFHGMDKNKSSVIVKKFSNLGKDSKGNVEIDLEKLCRAMLRDKARKVLQIVEERSHGSGRVRTKTLREIIRQVYDTVSAERNIKYLQVCYILSVSKPVKMLKNVRLYMELQLHQMNFENGWRKQICCE